MGIPAFPAGESLGKYAGDGYIFYYRNKTQFGKAVIIFNLEQGMELALASNNKHKLLEVRRKLEPLGLQVRGVADLPVDLDVEETGATFQENALLKAQALHRLTGLTALADDSGLVVDALNGRPGVHSARYAGETASDGDNIRLLLQELAGTSEEQRSAAFVCVLALCDGAEPHFFRGRCAGVIIEELRGSGGFGYDPVFYLPSLGKTMAELGMEEKNSLSHRARALEALVTYLKERPDAH